MMKFKKSVVPLFLIVLLMGLSGCVTPVRFSSTQPISSLVFEETSAFEERKRIPHSFLTSFPMVDAFEKRERRPLINSSNLIISSLITGVGFFIFYQVVSHKIKTRINQIERK